LQSGVERWYSESKAPIRNPAGEVLGLVGISRDVTVRKQDEARIARLTSVYSLISGINAAIVRATDRDTVLAESCRIAVAAGDIELAGVARVDARGVVSIVACEPVDAKSMQDIMAQEDGRPHQSPVLDK